MVNISTLYGKEGKYGTCGSKSLQSEREFRFLAVITRVSQRAISTLDSQEIASAKRLAMTGREMTFRSFLTRE